MAAVTECLIGRAIPRTREAEAAREIARRVPAQPARQDRDESPLLHSGAGDALVMAASTYEKDAPQVVAVVLEDGTVQTTGARGAGRRFSSGRLQGGDWTLWWERRRWAGAGS